MNENKTGSKFIENQNLTQKNIESHIAGQGVIDASFSKRVTTNFTSANALYLGRWNYASADMLFQFTINSTAYDSLKDAAQIILIVSGTKDTSSANAAQSLSAHVSLSFWNKDSVLTPFSGDNETRISDTIAILPDDTAAQWNIDGARFFGKLSDMVSDQTSPDSIVTLRVGTLSDSSGFMKRILSERSTVEQRSKLIFIHTGGHMDTVYTSANTFFVRSSLGVGSAHCSNFVIDRAVLRLGRDALCTTADSLPASAVIAYAQATFFIGDSALFEYPGAGVTVLCKAGFDTAEASLFSPTMGGNVLSPDSTSFSVDVSYFVQAFQNSRCAGENDPLYLLIDMQEKNGYFVNMPLKDSLVLNLIYSTE